MRILIAGCGYVGLPLATELVRQGHEVFGLRRSASMVFADNGIIPIQADITKAETLTKIPHRFDWVVNCAASGGGTDEDYRQLYLEGNRNLISWLRQSPPKKFVYTSSTSVYGQNDGSVVTEESPAQPEAPTARILTETEGLLLSAAQSGFPAVILRVAGIYGPGRGHAFKQFRHGEARIEGDGSRHYNMIHRDDLIEVIIAALERGEAGQIYNAADNEPVTQFKFYKWLAEKLNKPLPPVVPVDSEAFRKRGITNKRVSNAKLREKLKYEFQFPDFRAGYGAEIARLNRPAAP